MSEGRVALLALVVALAAAVGTRLDGAASVPAAVVVFPVAVAWVTRRPWLVFVAFAGLGLWRGAGAERAWGEASVAPGPLAGTVELVADPEPVGLGVPGVRAEARLADGRRIRVDAYGAAAGALGRAEVGSRLSVRGTFGAASDDSWNRARHLVGRATLDAAEVEAGPQGPWAWASVVRGRVAAGARSFDPDRRALYLGLVTGDDRAQSAAQRARFRAAGLSHLLAVSGQNVAFVLALAGPALRRLPIGARLPVVVGVLVVFGLVTRLEPSVVRATVTAAIATWAGVSGRRADGVRALSVAVLGLVLLDPFLVLSVGFRLSVAASAGIVVAGPAILARLRGPDWLAEPLAVTLAAQAAVLPLLTVQFGPIGLVSVPANLAAGWAAGLVMMWGVGPGVVLAGWAAPVSWPAGVLVWWIDVVARVAAVVPLPLVEVGLVAAGAAWWWSARLSGAGRRRVRAVVVGVVVVLRPGWVPAVGGEVVGESVSVAGGGEWWEAPDVGGVLVVGAGADGRLVGSLVEGRVSVGVVVSEGGARRHRDLVAEVVDVVDPAVVLAPPGHRVRGAYAVTDAHRLAVAGGVLVLESAGEVLDVRFEAGPAP